MGLVSFFEVKKFCARFVLPEPYVTKNSYPSSYFSEATVWAADLALPMQ